MSESNYNNRQINEIRTHRIEEYMDTLYTDKGISFERISDPVLQKKGIDLIINEKKIDEKAAISAWDRELKTFGLEVSSNSNVKNEGWLYSKKMVTDEYIFIYPRATDETLTTITSLEALFLKKKTLMEYLNFIGLDNAYKVKNCLYSFGHKTRRGKRWKINDRAEVVESIHLRERPVNILINRDYLRSLSYRTIKV